VIKTSRMNRLRTAALVKNSSLSATGLSSS
jgi:hypothetical protein